MIAIPVGWSSRRVGDEIVLDAPQGSAAASLRYRERLRPLRPARVLVRETAVPRGFVTTRVGAPIRLITDEGEHAALIEVDGTLGGPSPS